MSFDEGLHFAPFRLDLINEWLYRGQDRVVLRPKTYALLRYLAEHPNRLIPQEELISAVWHHTFLSDSLLRGCVRELRQALGDLAESPSVIETIRGRGIRFLPTVTVALPPIPQAIAVTQPPPYFVGRDDELSRLREHLDRARRGERQMVFVTGEAGTGKTALIDAFLSRIAAGAGVANAKGQCVENYGTGEAYHAMLEALTRWVRQPGGERIVEVLRRQAPTWLLQMPAFLAPGEAEAIRRTVFGTTQDCMARELTEVLETLTAEQPLVLCLDDLHWSDYSTVHFLSMLARRNEPARLLVIGTYRPAEAIVEKHPLRSVVSELRSHAHCVELPLPFLTLSDIAQYLGSRFVARPESSLLVDWGLALYRYTDGNPLFLVAIVDDLVARGVIGGLPETWQRPPSATDGARQHLPETLRQLIEFKVEQLGTQEQELLAAGSVAATSFSAALVAAVTDRDVASAEAHCEDLVHGGFLNAGIAWTQHEQRRSQRYQFRHALYQDVLYQRQSSTQRARFHRRIGEWKAALGGDYRTERAAELALHFERGADHLRAIHYYGQATQNALGRAAPYDALTHLGKALTLLNTLPQTPERDDQELGLQVIAGSAHLTTQGYLAPETKHAFERAQSLCGAQGENAQRFAPAFGLFRYALLGGKFDQARVLAEQLAGMAQSTPETLCGPAASAALGATLFAHGELTTALAQVEDGYRLYKTTSHEKMIIEHGEDSGSICLVHAMWMLQILGFPDRAQVLHLEYQALAARSAPPFLRVQTLLMPCFY